jgi:cell division protein FtsZ
LIATGFEHRDPFTKREMPQPEVKKEERVVMTLNGETAKKTQPTTQAAPEPLNMLAPKLVDETASAEANTPVPEMEEDTFELPYLQVKPEEKKEPPVNLPLQRNVP